MPFGPVLSQGPKERRMSTPPAGDQPDSGPFPTRITVSRPGPRYSPETRTGSCRGQRNGNKLQTAVVVPLAVWVSRSFRKGFLIFAGIQNTCLHRSGALNYELAISLRSFVDGRDRSGGLGLRKDANCQTENATTWFGDGASLRLVALCSAPLPTLRSTLNSSGRIRRKHGSVPPSPLKPRIDDGHFT